MRIANNFEAMKEVFTVSQNSSASHGKLLKQLTNIYQQDTLDSFVDNFTKLLSHCLIIGDKQPAVDRTLDFCVKFATSIGSGRDQDDSSQSDDTNPFLIELFEFMLKHSCAASQAVRFRVCQMIQKMLNALSDDATIDDELFTRIYDCMLERLRDKVAGIRVQAVFALQRLQEPGNKECPVIKAYIHHLHKDPHPDVRRAVLMNIASSVITLSHILDRCKDISDSVRKQAYVLIADKISVKSLSISQREKLLKMGLKDRSAAVRDVVEKRLLTSWLSRAETHIGLLRLLDVEASPESIDFALQTMFKFKTPKELVEEIILDENHLVPKEALSSHVALYWKSLSTYFQANGMDESLELILPELTTFVDYVKSYILEPTSAINESLSIIDDATVGLHYEFISNQLIGMFDVFDKSDESGRRHLLKTIRELLLNDDVTPRVARPLVRCYAKLENSPDTRTTTLLEIIADIREPLMDVEPSPQEIVLSREKELQLARLKVRLNVLQDDLETAIKTEDFAEAQKLKVEMKDTKIEMEKLTEIPEQQSQQVREERRDPQTLSKSLDIVSELLQSPQIKNLSPGIRTLLDNFILGCVSHEDPEVRHAAIKDVGICCTLDKGTAQNHCLLLTEAAQVDPFAAIRMTSVRVLFDLVGLYGLELFALNEEDGLDVLPQLSGKKSPDVSSFLIGLLDNESMEMQTLATEGLCKLLMVGRIQSSALLSRLLLQWYHPLTAGDEARHILGVFFSAFPAITRANQELFVGAFKPTLKTIINAPIHSPIAMIDLGEVLKKFVLFTSDFVLLNPPAEDDSNVHDSLALSFCQEILRNPDAPHSKILMKLLCSLQPALPNRIFVDDLRTLVRRSVDVVRDRPSLKLLEKFDQKLESRQEAFPSCEETSSTPNHHPVVRSMSNETVESLDSSGFRRRQLMSRHQPVFGDEEEEAHLLVRPNNRSSLAEPHRTFSDVDIPSESELSVAAENRSNEDSEPRTRQTNQPAENRGDDTMEDVMSEIDEGSGVLKRGNRIRTGKSNVPENSEESIPVSGRHNNRKQAGRKPDERDAESTSDSELIVTQGDTTEDDSEIEVNIQRNAAGKNTTQSRSKTKPLNGLDSAESEVSEPLAGNPESRKSARKKRVPGASAIPPTTAKKRVQVTALDEPSARAYPKTPKSAAPKTAQKATILRSTRSRRQLIEESPISDGIQVGQQTARKQTVKIQTAQKVTRARRQIVETPDDDSSQAEPDDIPAEKETAQKVTRARRQIVQTPDDDSSLAEPDDTPAEKQTARKATAKTQTAQKPTRSRRQLIETESSNEVFSRTDSDEIHSAKVIVKRIPVSVLSKIVADPKGGSSALGEPQSRKTNLSTAKKSRFVRVNLSAGVTPSPVRTNRGNRISGVAPFVDSPLTSPVVVLSRHDSSKRSTLQHSNTEKEPVRTRTSTRNSSLWSEEESRTPPARSYQARSSEKKRVSLAATDGGDGSPVVTPARSAVRQRPTASAFVTVQPSPGELRRSIRSMLSPRERRLAIRNSSANSSFSSPASEKNVLKLQIASAVVKEISSERSGKKSQQSEGKASPRGTLPATRAAKLPLSFMRRPRVATSSETESSPDVRQAVREDGSKVEGKKGEPAKKSPRLQPGLKQATLTRTRMATNGGNGSSASGGNSSSDFMRDVSLTSMRSYYADSDEDIIPNSPGASERSFIPGSSMCRTFFSKVTKKK